MPPLNSNQKTNSYLKEIAKDCDIQNNLTFYVAIRTIGTSAMLFNGVPIETVSKLLGWNERIKVEKIRLSISSKAKNKIYTFTTISNL